MKVKSLTLYLLLLAGSGVVLQGCIDSEDPNKQLNSEIKQIDNYLTANSVTDIKYDQYYGFRFLVHTQGSGFPPHTDDVVTGTYSGKYLTESGTLETFIVATPLTGKVQDLEPLSLRYIVSVMLEGTTATIFSPSKFSYGEAGNSALGVPANTPIIYTVVLDEVKKPTAWTGQFSLDLEAIDTYLTNKPIENAVYDERGFYYTIDTPNGTGAYANPYSFVTFDYKLQILLASGPGGIIQQSTLTDANVFGLIDGLKLGIPKMQTGNKYTFYIPSGLAYGDQAQNGIPKNSNLVFEITLTAVK